LLITASSMPSLLPTRSMSAWVTVWEPVQLMLAPGASVATGTAGVHTRLPAINGSTTVTFSNGTLPVLVVVS
jgi:hypothetical protein